MILEYNKHIFPFQRPNKVEKNRMSSEIFKQLKIYLRTIKKSFFKSIEIWDNNKSFLTEKLLKPNFQSSMVDLINVRLHDSEEETKIICINPNDSVQVLVNSVKGDDRRFLFYKGGILMTAFSFKFFKISDGDDIYVLRTSNSKKKNLDKNFEETKKSTLFQFKTEPLSRKDLLNNEETEADLLNPICRIVRPIPNRDQCNKICKSFMRKGT